MADFPFRFRSAITCLLVGTLSVVAPAMGAEEPRISSNHIAGIQALESAVPQPGMLASQDQTPQAAVQPADQAAPTAAPPKHHLSPWVWVAIVAGVAAGAGAAILAANGQSGKTSAPVTSITLNVGGASAAAPH